MSIKDIMTDDVAFSTPDTSLADIARMMVDCDCGEIPLVTSAQDKKVVGVITDRDIVCRTLALGKNPMDLTARECMTSPAVTVSIDSDVDDCLELMQEKKIRRIPIVDKNQILCGIVTQADLIQAADEDEAVDMIQEVSKPSSSPSQVQ